MKAFSEFQLRAGTSIEMINELQRLPQTCSHSTLLFTLLNTFLYKQYNYNIVIIPESCSMNNNQIIKRGKWQGHTYVAQNAILKDCPAEVGGSQ